MFSELAHLCNLTSDCGVYLAELAETSGQFCSDSLRVPLRVFGLDLLTLECKLFVLGLLRQHLRLARQDIDFLLHLLDGEPGFLGKSLQSVLLCLELVVHLRKLLDLLLDFYRLYAESFQFCIFYVQRRLLLSDGGLQLCLALVRSLPLALERDRVDL